MISVLVNWAYVFIVTFILGRFALTRAYRFYGYEKNTESVKISSAVAAGLAVTTVYAGFFSVFYKVGIVANIIMIALCAAFVFIDRKYYAQMMRVLLSDGENSAVSFVLNLGVWKIAILAVLFVAVVFFTSEGQFFSDSGFYHEQSIRWIEEYGTVKGSCHILKRLAYNSSYFVQCALFSMRDLWGQSLHCLGGFYAIFLMTYSIVGFSSGRVRTNLLRVAPIIYFVMFCSEITSPASDFPLVFLICYVAIRWFELGDEEAALSDGISRNNGYAPYAMLSLFVVFIISIKLTVGCLVLIVIKPAITMIQEKKIKEIIVSIVSGFVIILPYFIRNYLICGWLIYPFTAIDLFNPEWKMLAEFVQADADEIKVWGRGMGMLGGHASDSIRVWLPHWWEYMSIPNRRIVGALGIVAVAYAIYRVLRLILQLIGGRITKGILKDSVVINRLVFELAIFVSIVFWFVEAPLFRYGIAYILVVLFYMLGDMLDGVWSIGISGGAGGNSNGTAGDLHMSIWIVRGIGAILAVALILPMTISIKDYIHWDYECIRYYSDYEYFFLQEDYPRVEYKQKELDGVTVYYPAEEMGEIGYHIFPSIWNSDTGGVKKLGEDIKDGFKFVPDED